MNLAPSNEQTRGPIAWMTRHSVAPNLLMAFLLIGGLMMSMRIKQEVFPEFDLGMVTITVPYPGASPEEVEQGIVLAVEESLRGMTGIEEITANAREGAAVIMAELEENADETRVYQEIKQEIDRITTLPEEAEEPDVILATHRREVMDVILYGDTDEWVLRKIAERVRDRMLNDPDISQIDIAPDRIFEVSIHVPQETLRAYNLTLNDIAGVIRQASIELPAGYARTEGGDLMIRVTERRDWAKEFAEIPIVTSAAGTQLLLGDLGTITDTFEETHHFLSYNGLPAVSLDVFRVGEQTPIGVSDAVRKKLAEIAPSLPEGIKVAVPRDMSDIYRQRLELLMRNGFMGLILVLCILTIFLEYKLAFWVTMGIPISFLGSFLFLPGADVTINMISMFAFIVSLGIVVDDAIVVGENIFEYRQAGMNRMEAAIQGARDVAMPVTFSILTNLAAFAPLAFVPGFMGKIWRVIPLVVASVFLISLVESLFILPAHLAHTRKEGSNFIGKSVHRMQDRLSRFLARQIELRFGRLLDGVLRYRYLTVSIAVTILLLVIGYAGSGRLGMEWMPKVESDHADATAVLPYGSPLSKLEDVQKRLVAAVEEIAAQQGYEDLLEGTRAQINQNKVEVTAYLTDPGIRPISTSKLTQLWRQQVGQIEGLEWMRFQSDRGGPGGGASLSIELAHTDIDVLDQASQDLASELALFTNVKDIDDGYTPGKQQIDVTILPEGRSLGLTAAEIARQLRASFYGAEAKRQQRELNEIKVMVRLPKAQRITEYDIESFMVRTPQGVDVPLRQVAETTRGRSYTVITRRDGRRTVTVTANVEPQSEAEQVVASLSENALVTLQQKYPWLTYSFSGRQEDMRESMQTLGKGYIMALMLIFVLLGIPFRSYTQPLIVMISIPFGIVGAVLGHMLMGYSLSIISMMGVIALSGVVVNDALVLIEYANRQRQSGLSAMEAVHNAGVRRFRPILLTTVTTFGGLAPMIFETSRQARFLIPMALSLGYGILFATLITLLIVPTLYLILDDLKRLIALPEPESPTQEAAPSAV